VNNLAVAVTIADCIWR